MKQLDFDYITVDSDDGITVRSGENCSEFRLEATFENVTVIVELETGLIVKKLAFG